MKKAHMSEIHVTCESTEQPHLADDCDSDVEMPGPGTFNDMGRENGSPKSFFPSKWEAEKLKVHLNVMLSDTSHLTKRRMKAEAFRKIRNVFVG